MVYFGSEFEHLYAVDIKSGEEKWRFKTGSEGVSSSPKVSEEVVFIGSYDNHLYAINIVKEHTHNINSQEKILLKQDLLQIHEPYQITEQIQEFLLEETKL